MIRVGTPVVRQSALCLALAAIAGVFVRGADDGPTVPSAPPSENSIATAKRDLESIKASRDPLLQPKAELPRLGMPEMRAGPSESAGWSQSKTTAPAQKSSNWLIEAMEKKPESRHDRDRTTLERERAERGSDAREKGTTETAGDRNERESSSKAGEKSATAAANPFSRFLSSWMSPQDYALLQPGLAQTGTGQIDTRLNSPSAQASPALGVLPAPNAVFGLVSNTQPVAAPPTPRENPYLSALSVPPPATVALTPPPANISVVPPVTAVPVSVAPPPTPPAKSVVPDFARPLNDDKYFKQLKRF